MATVESLIKACVDDFRKDYSCCSGDDLCCNCKLSCEDHFVADGWHYRIDSEAEFGEARVSYVDGWFAAAARWNQCLHDAGDDVFDFSRRVSEVLFGNEEELAAVNQ